jgi:hypothetical protein
MKVGSMKSAELINLFLYICPIRIELLKRVTLSKSKIIIHLKDNVRVDVHERSEILVFQLVWR